MATITSPHTVPVVTGAHAAPAPRSWVAPTVAAGAGAAAAVAVTWWVVASQTFELSMRTMGF
jgi:hypothetical protein